MSETGPSSVPAPIRSSPSVIARVTDPAACCQSPLLSSGEAVRPGRRLPHHGPLREHLRHAVGRREALADDVERLHGLPRDLHCQAEGGGGRHHWVDRPLGVSLRVAPGWTRVLADWGSDEMGVCQANRICLSACARQHHPQRSQLSTGHRTRDLSTCCYRTPCKAAGYLSKMSVRVCVCVCVRSRARVGRGGVFRGTPAWQALG